MNNKFEYREHYIMKRNYLALLEGAEGRGQP